MGLFIGASILSLYEVSIYYLLRFITRIKSRFGSSLRIEDLKTGYNGEGPDGVIKINDSTFQLKKNITSKPSRFSYSENENTKLLINIQEELAKQGDVLANLGNMLEKQGEMLAKHDNDIKIIMKTKNKRLKNEEIQL